MKELLDKIYNKQSISQKESESIFDLIVSGQLSEIEITGLLIGLKMKGEEPEEIAGAAMAMRSHAVSLGDLDYDVVDSCGTGGSGMHTVNISTMVAVLLAECGLYVAKHGNRSISSKCGSADVLESLGLKLDLTPEQAKVCLDKENFCFLFAPNYHPGVKHVMPVRNQLKTRTIFNLLGPLINPAKPKIQLMGVYSPQLCYSAAETLRLSGCQSAMVVHSAGYDEITLHSPTQVVQLLDNKIETCTISNQDFGLPNCRQEDIAGSVPKTNAELFRDVLLGQHDSKKKLAIAHTVAANAGALLLLSGKATSLKNGAEQAMDILKNGRAFGRLQNIIELSQSFAAHRHLETNNV